MNRSLEKSKLLSVFAITALIFIIGILIGNYTTGLKFEKVESMQDDLKTQAMALELQYEILANDPCKLIDAKPLTDELYKIGSRLTYLENSLGKSDPAVIQIKEYYHLLELRHWLFFRKTQKECNTNNTLVLYFYSNEGDCTECQQQGFIVDYVHEKVPMNVYSFDVNIENPALYTVKELYSVDSTPVLVIDEDVHRGFIGKKELLELVSHES